ncbi:hypothetical protein PsorP6_006495 [Peronosclerospora sorghi]|uniref:Uncharacterized protein n=1 Tax=Peronosclerospora sorghi TaxID=230839 RepID=A0ACC0W2S8_9STRA|nr:hypothetical protein PsorP6_006495 [Peronosclerospora sorghi]
MFPASRDAAPTSPPSMSHEQLLAHQLDLHHKIQQQMQLQREMSLQFGSSAPPRPSLTSSLAKVEPDLGDNVFDMLDDLIMIPSGAVAPERASLSKHAREERMDDHDHDALDADDDDDGATTSASLSSARDSLADILESLDLDDDDLNDETWSSGSESRARSASDSFLDDAELDDSSEDVDALESEREPSTTHEKNADAPTPPPEEDFVHLRRSSVDLLASMHNSTSSLAATGSKNMCTLIWEGGLLGLRLRHSQSRMRPAVSKITGKSTIFGIHLVHVGDLVLEIGDRATSDMAFLDAIQYLKDVPKPCRLVFQRVSGSDPMAVLPVQPQVQSPIGLKLAHKFQELTAAEQEKFPPQPVVKLEAKYEIKWLEGPLGISLIASKDVSFPLVTRITGKNRSPQVQDVQPGHYLVQIGNYNTAEGNFNTAIKYLQKVQKPVSLYFCPSNKQVSARPEPQPNEFDHVWEKKQPLCFTVRPNGAGHMVVADVGTAKSIKVKIKGAPTNVAAFVSSGDEIVWINDDCIQDLRFHDALLKLRTAKRPLVIRFRKALADATPSSLTPDVPPAAHVTSSSSSTSESGAPSTTSPPKAVLPPVPMPRSFINPLKKMSIALGTHPKDVATPTTGPAKVQTDPRKQPLVPSPAPQQQQQQQQHPPPPRPQPPKQPPCQPPKPPPMPPHQPKPPLQQLHHVQHHVSPSHPTLDALPTKYRNPTEQEAKRAVQEPRSVANGASRVVASTASGAHGGHFHTAPAQLPSRDPSPRTASSGSELFGGPSHQPKARSVDPGGRKSPLPTSASDPLDLDAPVKPLARSGPRPSAGPPPPVPRSDDVEKDVYEVVWPEGTALGLTLRVHPTTRFPVVARVTGTSNLKNIGHVSPGDILFAANNMNIVPQPKFKQTLENLSRLPKPAVLRFRRASAAAYAPVRADATDHALLRGPPLQDREYELIWREHANLGLVFSSDADVPKVTKVDLDSGGPMLHRVSLGDVLTWIGPMEISGASFHSSMATLRAVKRPVVLRFFKRGT